MTNLTPGFGQALSLRELRVLALVAQGLSNAQVGERLFVTEATVKTHVQRVLAKLGATTRAHAVALAYQGRLFSTAYPKIKPGPRVAAQGKKAPDAR